MGSFRLEDNGNASGTVYVNGFLKTSLVSEPYCIGSCRFYRYASIELVDIPNPDLRDFLFNQRSMFADPSHIGLGCLEYKNLVYVNDSDDLQRKEFLADATIMDALFASSPQHPISLVLTKHRLSNATEAPVCYAHFTEIALWNGKGYDGGEVIVP